MKVLFDQNTPRTLARYLTQQAVTRTAELGWEEMKNGDLLKAAESEGFEVFVTADKNLRYQQNLLNRKIGLVVLPSGQWPAIKTQLGEVVSAIDQATPGSFREIAPLSSKRHQ